MKKNGAGIIPRGMTLSYVYMFLFSLRFSEAFWVIYLRSRGLSFAAVGLAETVFHLAALFGEVPTGWIADRFGRKTSLLAGRILSIIAALLALRATGLGGFAAAFAVSALSFTCHSGAYDAMVFDELKASGRAETFTRVMGAINALYLVGSSLACLLGGLVAQRSLPFLYVLSIGVDSLAILLLLPLAEVRAAGAEETRRVDLRREARELAATLRNNSLASLLFFWAFVSALATSFYFYGQGYLREARVPLALIGLAGMLGNLAAIVPTTLAYRVEKRFGSRLPLFAGGALVPLLILGAGLIPAGASAFWHGILFLLLLAVNVVIEGLYPLFNNAVNVLVPSDRRATVLSSGSMLFSLIMMAVFPLIGYCGDHLGLARGFALTGGGALAGGVIVLVWRRWSRERTASRRRTRSIP